MKNTGIHKNKPGKSLFKIGMILGFVMLAAALAAIQALEAGYWIKLALSLLAAGAGVGIYALVWRKQNKQR